MAVLKVLGFRPNQILMLVLGEVLLVGVGTGVFCAAAAYFGVMAMGGINFRVAFFPLAWTIVHPIDDFSPLRTMSKEELSGREAEFLVLLNGFDETFSQTVHTRSSYTGEEIVCGAKFRNMFTAADDDGEVAVDIRKLHEFDIVSGS